MLVAAVGAPLTSLALLFGPPEYFSLMVLGLIFAVVLAKGSVLKAVTMVVTGLLLSMVGSDLETGAGRVTFDIAELADAIGFARSDNLGTSEGRLMVTCWTSTRNTLKCLQSCRLDRLPQSSLDLR